jgi:putative phosphoribosyl transferase
VALPRFRDRTEAGRRLVGPVAALAPREPLVLALPRGGVEVGAALAAGLGAPLDVLVARKIGAPGHAELGVGALAEGGEPVFDGSTLRHLGLRPADLADTVARERAELGRRVLTYRDGRPPPEVRDREVVLVDDGLATGGTARAALRALAAAGARRRILAVPVGPADTVEALRPDAEDLVVLVVPTSFRAVSLWYDEFPQATDAEVVAQLTAARRRAGGVGR